MSRMSELDVEIKNRAQTAGEARKVTQEFIAEHANSPEVLAWYAEALAGTVLDRITIKCAAPNGLGIHVRFDTSASDGIKVFAARYDDPLITPGALAAARAHCLKLIKAAQAKNPEMAAASVYARSTEERIAIARQVWEASTSELTLAREYLAGRGIQDIVPYEGRVIRVKYGTKYIRLHSGKPDLMVCAMRDVVTDEITAVHQTFFDEDWQPIIEDNGRKMRRTLGVMNCDPIHAAIKFATQEEVLDAGALVIGEGVETCLSAIQLGWSPVWAMGSTGNIAKLPVIDGIDELIILGERDNGASERVTKTAIRRWILAGRRAECILPNEGFKDFNDQIQGKRS